MKKQTRRLLSTVLSATTIMSMLTFAPTGVSAVDDTKSTQENTVVKQSKLDEVSTSDIQINTEQSNTEYDTQFATGDLTTDLPDDVEIIESPAEYYKLIGKKYKVPSGGSLASSLPSSADNSQSEYFPKIGNQGGIGSCVAWAQSYYQYTYTVNKARGVVTTPENTYSPKFTYALANGGEDKGSVSQNVYHIMKTQGNVPISMVPYDDDCFSWSPTKEVWRESIKNRVSSFQYFDEIGESETQVTSADDDDLIAVKTALSNGEVLTYSTNISDWQKTKLKTNSAAPENSKFAGQEAVTHQDDSTGGHRMTLVGYNDNIWIDVNGNNTVDTGEMGAFKIANSWGDGYANDGFMWIAYDALNKETAVSGGPTKKVRILRSIARIEVEPVDEHADVYLQYTLNSAHRYLTDAVVTAEKHGTIYSASVFTSVSTNSAINFSYIGTKTASDGTMVFSLDNVVPGLTSENFSEYTWSVEFKDKKSDSMPLIVKSAEIVDETANKSYKPTNVYPFTLENNSKTVEFFETALNDVVVYYRGYYSPTLHYKVGNNAWKTIQLEDCTERRGYTQKYVIELAQQSDVKVYFSDNKGNTDNNNGSYYTAKKGLNYFVTENVADPLKVNMVLADPYVDIKKLLDFEATSSGGYAPYLYQFTYTNLDTGQETTTGYLTRPGVEDTSVCKRGQNFSSVGNYRITVNVKDYSDTVVSASLDLYIDDKPFEYTSFTATPDKQVMVGDTVDLTASTNYENIIYVGRPKNQHSYVIKDESGNVVYTKSFYAQVYSLNYKTSTPTLSWVPTKAGNYTVTVSTTDGNNQYAEKSIKVSVTDYNGTIVGDADNNKQVNLTDALLIMKYNVGGIDSSKLWLALSDSNADDKIDLRDAIYILRYTISSGDIANVGKVNFRETPTDPPTEPPTEKPTDPPTEKPTNPVTSNTVTFTNSHRWGGTMYCYYWSDTNKTMTSWPGKPMTNAGVNSFGETLYTFVVPQEATYIIFTNGSSQTVDIPYAGGEVKYYPLTTTNSLGHYNVETW